MTSLQTRGVTTFLRLVMHPATSTRQRGLRALTRGTEPVSPPRRVRDRVVRLDLGELGQHQVDMLVPVPSGRPPPGTAVVYFHGGAFVNGITRQHWELVADLADASGSVVYVPHYGRAPRHTGQEVFALFDALLEHVGRAEGRPRDEQGRPARVRIHLAGDSAGGTLALLAAQHLRDDRVVGITLISPALDLSQSNPEIPEVERSDPWLSRAGTAPLLQAWAGDRDLQDPVVSPLFGDLSGLPPIHVFAGTRDICWPDVTVLQRRADEAGTRLTVHAAEGSPHVHVLLPTPEGRGDRATLLGTVARSLRG